MPTAQEIYQQLHAAKQSGQFQGGPVFPMMGVMPSIIAGVQGLFGDDPKRYVDGREVLAGQIPWGKPGRIPQERLDQWINERNKLYHATQPESIKNIIESGEIQSTSHSPAVTGVWGQKYNEAQEQLTNAGKQMLRAEREGNHELLQASRSEVDRLTTLKRSYIEQYYKSPEGRQALRNMNGVSVSRVPKANSNAYNRAPITLELDPAKMPANRPFAETGWEKTRSYVPDMNQIGVARHGLPNPRFEFENRTYNEPIPATAITKAMVDRSLLGSGNTPDGLFTLFKTLRENNIPVQDYINARAMHSYRARIGADVKRKLLEKALGAGQ